MKEVILMAKVEGLGAEGDVVQVSDGFARNFLLPRKKAALVTEASRRQVEKKRQERVEREKTELGAAAQMAQSLQSISCTITVKTGDEGKMFGSVTTADIAANLKEQGVEVDRHAVQLKEAIKEIGVYDVQLKLHNDVAATIKVWVVEE